MEFTADGSEVILSADQATMLPISGKVVQPQSSGSATEGFSATGEPVLPLESGNLTMRHATWFANAVQGSVQVQPAPWNDEVMTCYLKTEVPVSLSGVNWLFGAPVMVERYTYVIALQQLGESVVFANLAYTIPQ